MVSPSKAKLSRIAGQQQQQEEQEQQQQLPSQASQRKSTKKVQLVKGPKPLVYHRFYLDVEQHQVATKIETTIKQLGGSIEFFLTKDITHFITDKLQHGEQFFSKIVAGETCERKDLPTSAASPSPGVTNSNEQPLTSTRRFPSVPSPATGTPLLQQLRHPQQQQSQRSSRQLLHLTHQQHTHGQYVNDYEPATSRTSSPCPPPITSSTTTVPSTSTAACITTSGAASVPKEHAVLGSTSSTPASVGFDGKVKPIHLSSNGQPTAAAVPRSRADAMLQRVRQQQQQQTQYTQQPAYGLLHSSPLNPTTSGVTYGSTPTKVSTPSPFQSSSHHKQAPSPCYSPAGAGAGGNLGAVTRPTSSRQNSPVQLVRSWGTLVWSAEYTLKFLRKVLGSLPKENGTKRAARTGAGTVDVKSAAGEKHHRHHHHRHNGSRASQHVHHLRGPFIKIECRSAPYSYRPVYKEFKRWPALLQTEKELAGKKAPFADANEPSPAVRNQPGTGRQDNAEGTGAGRMTRKLSSTTNTAARTGSTTTGKLGDETGLAKKRTLEKPPAVPPRDCGYCEICRLEYDSLAVHVQSESHQTFVRNDDNFVSLDRLLDSFGGGCGVESGDTARHTLAEEGYDTEEGTVAAEAFFQQLQNTVRINRTVEEPVENRRKEEQEEGQQKKTSSTTVTVAVTTTTTAAADELIEREKTPIGDSIAKNEVAEVKQEQPQRHDSTALKETEQLRQSKKTQKKKGTRAKVKEQFDAVDSGQQCERLDSKSHKHSTPPGPDSDGDGSRTDSSDCGNSTKELIKLAIKSVIATFECSDSEFLADVERSLDNSVRLDDSGVQCVTGSVKEQVDKCTHPNVLVGESDSCKRAANSSNNLTSRDSSGIPQGHSTTRTTRACKRQTDTGEGTSRGERRVSNRLSQSAVPLLPPPPAPVSSAFREVTGTLNEHLTEASSEGMFGRRSAIHHHPHNQLNHHNHQKHKSTLSALLLKQQQERDQQQQQQQPPSAADSHEWEEHKTTASGTVDHAAGMKVLTDFRKQRSDDELVPDKSVLLVGPAAEVGPVAANEKLHGLESSNIKSPTSNRRKRNPRSDRQEDAMGLKASTVATNKHHHHHAHVAHLNDGAGTAGGGTKTRHATELAATLLECDGLDPKNTKRISLGLRQNPKRANLNEDFTSLLDETLERTKTSTSSASARRTAQSRIRGPTKGKEQTVTKQPPAAEKVEEEKQNHRGCEKEEPSERRETLAHDRIPTMESVSTSTKRTTGAVSKKAANLEGIKVRGIRWRAPSPTTRPPVKSPLLYKVIDHQAAGEDSISTNDGLNERITTPSSRTATAAGSRNDTSTAGGNVGSNSQHTSNQSRTSKSSTAAKHSGSSPGKKNGLIVKIRRVRQSELSLLNDEAENFMFPRKDDSSSDEDTDDDRQTSSEGFHAAAGANNFSVDLASSSEGDRDATTHKNKEEDRHSEEEEEEPVLLSDAKHTGVVGSRKRKKVIAAAVTKADGSDDLSSTTSPLKSDPSIGPAVKRARLEPSTRRKGQLSADYEKGQDPAGSRMRFPEAPIQPSTTVATAKPTVSSTDRLRRRRSQSNASEDKGHEAKRDDEEEAKLSDDDVEGEEEEEEEEEDKKKKRKGGVTARTRRVQKKLDREEETVPDSTSLPSPPGLCISCIARSSRGRGRGGVTGRRGRRGVRGGVGRGGDRRAASRLQSGGASCTCHLLDASRMPPPSSRRRNNESVERSGTPVSQRSSGTRASKTKTTPPNAAVSAGAASSASSSLAGSCAMMGNTGMCGSYIKGKEDGMGAVFKWINFRKRCEEIEPYRFAFERVPSLEPWYETFQRQDDGTEKVYEYFGSTGYRKLPYEMGPLPALGQNCCILNYKVIASRKSNRTASLQSSSSASMEPASPSAGKKSASRLSSSEVTTTATHSASAVNESDTKKLSPSSSLSSLPLKKRKLLLQEGGAGSGGSTLKTDGSSTGGAELASHSGRIARLIAGGSERPRKSPREHASTLAILSLLQQQQHRKRAGTIKILTSPKKATTATATQTTTLHEQLLHQDADSNGEELSRSCSRASDRGSSRAGSSTGGGIKFDRPLFPDSNYVNSRTLCQELDAFLSDELKRVAGEGSRATLDGIVKQELADPDAADEQDELLTDGGSLVQSKSDVSTHEHSAIEMPELDQELLPPPSVAQEGIAIERNALSVSKRDLLDVLQTVGTEPPLSLKLVQRCETVVKKIVQYDRKERSMLASGSGSGLAISSASPVIGLQLFDSGSSLAGCGPGTGVGSVGGSFLKKRINRTGWPTNKRKIGTRTRQQSRFMLPALTKKSLSRESVKKEEPDDGEAAESKDEHDASRQCVVKKHEDDEDTDEEEDEDDEEDDEAQEEEEDRSELVTAGKVDGAEDDEDDDALVKLKEKEIVSPARCMPRKDVAQATANEKTDCVRRKQQPSKEEEESTAKRSEPQSIERRRRKRSFGKSNETRKLNASKRGHLNKAPGKQHTDDGEKKNEESEAEDVVKLASQEVVHEKSDEKERNTIAFDSMPTLRAALMRDNSQLQRSMASSMLLPSSPTKPTSISSLSMPGSLNRGTVPHATGRATPAIGGCESLLCPASSPGASSGQVLGASCCKYITKTTTTMTRVDYDGGGNVTSSGLSHPPLKLKHSREDVSTTNEEEEQPHSHREDTRQKQSCAPNRYRGAASSSTAIGSAALTTTHDSDDKECDSISSRSIFVSDDCDTTSSSTAINPPDDRSPSTGELPSTTPGYSNHLPHTEPGAAASHSSDVTSSSSSLPMNPRLSTARVRRKESSDNEESVQTVAEATHNKRSSEKYVLVNKSSKSPRTPSERIRNKMVKNRRVAIRMATAAIEKQEATKTHDVQTAKTVPSSKRRKSSSLGPPLPPPTVMPLSPPLTTSTSSSSSSSYGADDKAPLSPVGVVTAVRRKTHTDDDIIIGDELLQDEQSAQHSSSANSVIEHNHNVGIALTPSKIKTRSSTFGHSPPKRTYGRATVSSKKLPFVSLVKTAFVPEGEIDAEATLVNGTKSPGNKKGNKRKRCGSSVEKKASNKSSLSMKKVLKKRQKPEQHHVTATKRKQMQAAGVAGGLGGKRSKKLSARSKQAVARRKLQKSAQDAETSGHFNNNSDALANVANLEQGEEEDPLSTSHVQEHSIEQQQDHHGSEEFNQRQHHHTTTRAHDLMEEHLIEEEEAEEEELLERNEGGDAVEEEDELDGVEEEEHYELLELMEVEEQAEEEEMGDVAEDEEEEETHQVEEEEEEEEDVFLTREDVSQQQQQDDEERKLIMADHDYSDQQVDPALVDAEFVEVEELEEDDLECDEEEEMGEGEQEEVAEEEEEELEEDEAAHHHHDGDEDDDYNDDEEEEEDDDTTTISEDHPRRVTVAPSALSFDKQQRVKLSYASSSGASSALTITSSTTPKTVAASTSAATTKSFNSTTTTSSPTKYSPRKLRKPRGRWYRER